MDSYSFVKTTPNLGFEFEVCLEILTCLILGILFFVKSLFSPSKKIPQNVLGELSFSFPFTY
ncbi:MAG: hypothetical protein AMJ91_03540 [candidate division Zixibacteria bacterium SM23_73_3]|nr:MAG: hypothetical protein AMJ91_03540 [candidate division Zixibacteria bacterium SM23_73_3]